MLISKSKKAVRVGLIPILSNTISEFLTKTAAAIKNAADDKSPGTEMFWPFSLAGPFTEIPEPFFSTLPSKKGQHALGVIPGFRWF